MIFYPVNKYLHVEKLEKPKKQGAFYVEETNTKNTGLETVKLKRAAEGSSYVPYEGDYLIVSGIHIEEIDFNGTKVLIVPEQSVYGRVLLTDRGESV